MAERDLRSDLLNTLLTSPHRDLAQTHGMHQTMIEADPRFYVHLASWYADRGHVRDHKEMFVAMLCLSKFEGHRDVGLAILADLPPYEVARVVDFVKGYEQKQRRRKEPRAQGRKREVEKIVKKQVGLFQNIPRSLRSEAGRYLKEREADHQRFDRTALTARKALKRLYAGLHIQPSARAQAVLFDDDPPPDSLAFAVKQIAKALTPADQARAIAAHRIPYRVASTIIKD